MKSYRCFHSKKNISAELADDKRLRKPQQEQKQQSNEMCIHKKREEKKSGKTEQLTSERRLVWSVDDGAVR